MEKFDRISDILIVITAAQGVRPVQTIAAVEEAKTQG